MKRIAALLASAVFMLASGPAWAQQISLRMGHDQPVGSMYDEGHNMFKKLVEERSSGGIKAPVFPAPQRVGPLLRTVALAPAGTVGDALPAAARPVAGCRSATGTCESSASMPPGRRRSAALRQPTFGSTQWKAVAEKTPSN